MDWGGCSSPPSWTISRAAWAWDPKVPEPHGNCLFYFHGLNIVPSLCTQYSVQRVHKSLYFEQLLQIITGFRPADKLKIDTHACSVCQLKTHLQIFTNHESKQRWPNMLMREWIWSQIEIINLFTHPQSVDPPPNTSTNTSTKMNVCKFLIIKKEEEIVIGVQPDHTFWHSLT